jgi:two-component system, OmpR family, sensor kinase
MAFHRITLAALQGSVTAALLLGAVVSSGLTSWVVIEAQQSDQRIALAHASYAEHLVLQANLYRLFKENADALLIGDRDASETERLVDSAISGSLDRIRTIISNEIEIAGEEEFEELITLAKLERLVLAIKQRYRDLTLKRKDSDGAPTNDLVGLLDRDIDQDLSGLIAEALAGESAEVAQAQQTADDFRARVTRISLALVGLMALVAISIAVIYRRHAAVPLQRLVQGADDYRQGNFDRAIPAGGTTELRHLALTLSDMARGITDRERNLTDQAHRLEQRVAERTSELELLLARLEQSEVRRRQMMADVSHELRTPLTIIQGEADVALRNLDGLTDQVVDSFSRIRDASRHTNRIVDDLLLVAREESGQLRLDLRNIDLDVALAEVCDLAPGMVEVVRYGQPVPCRVDPLRFRQSILAVMNNAVRYGGKKISARIETGGGATDVLVEDDGPGMSTADKDQAFVRFFRGSGFSGSGAEGTGLGLPIVQSIMRAHGGSVDLLDRDGGGLIVRLRFPRPVRPLASNGERIVSKTA